ncbi:hypothetical protein HD554DRAFT_1619438 [Boletus coccyginus]|nr:hypothetical protein HD554DRAFT_1619438 [Boletus coccyginus]
MNLGLRPCFRDAALFCASFSFFDFAVMGCCCPRLDSLISQGLATPYVLTRCDLSIARFFPTLAGQYFNAEHLYQQPDFINQGVFAECRNPRSLDKQHPNRMISVARNGIGISTPRAGVTRMHTSTGGKNAGTTNTPATDTRCDSLPLAELLLQWLRGTLPTTQLLAFDSVAVLLWLY